MAMGGDSVCELDLWIGCHKLHKQCALLSSMNLGSHLRRSGSKPRLLALIIDPLYAVSKRIRQIIRVLAHQ